MAGAAGAAQTASGGAGGGGSAVSGQGNAFWQVTNLYSRKNKLGQVTGQQLGAGQIDGGGAIDAVGFLRGPRLEVRTTGAGAGTPTADNPANFFKYLGLLDTDGTPIINPLIDGWSWLQMQRYFRPWLKDPVYAWDYAQSVSPSFTVFLQPEVRQQLAVLENTDTRQQYSWTHSINTAAAIGATGTAPTVSVTAYVDVWAQPDVTDLEGVDNERIPPGVNLQTKVRKQTFTLNNAGSDNIFLSSLTGNALRGGLLVVRDSNNARQDYLANPINWMLDDRTLSIVDTDMYFQWEQDFYASFGQQRAPRPTGLYAFPRFYNVGALLGQGWLYTSNATAVSWESSTSATATNVPGSVTLLQEEVYNVGPIDTSLLDL
jgi:hypothetical protein